jgi:hypothetical protein
MGGCIFIQEEFIEEHAALEHELDLFDKIFFLKGWLTLKYFHSLRVFTPRNVHRVGILFSSPTYVYILKADRIHSTKAQNVRIFCFYLIM